MKDRIRRDENFWQATLTDQNSSNLSVNAYCRKHQLSPATFYKWKKRLSQATQQTSAQTSLADPLASTLVELAVQNSDAGQNASGPQRMLEASRADGTLLRFHGAFDADTIIQIIAGESGGRQ